MSKRVTRIDELAQNVPPPRDLWPAISAAIEADRAGAAAAPARRRAWMPAAGMAAAVALVAIGVLIGMRIEGGQTLTAGTKVAAPAPAQNVFPVAFGDQKYRTQRAALMVEVEGRLRTMTPAERAKIQGSLDTLQKSIAEIEAALGKDPANALLQELLVNSCQEEMRALTAVRDSGGQES